MQSIYPDPPLLPRSLQHSRGSFSPGPSGGVGIISHHCWSASTPYAGSLHSAHPAVRSPSIKQTSFLIPAKSLLLSCCPEPPRSGRHLAPAKRQTLSFQLRGLWFDSPLTSKFLAPLRLHFHIWKMGMIIAVLTASIFSTWQMIDPQGRRRRNHGKALRTPDKKEELEAVLVAGSFCLSASTCLSCFPFPYTSRGAKYGSPAAHKFIYSK